MLEPLLGLNARSHDIENNMFDSHHEDSLVDFYADYIENDRALDIVEPLMVIASLGTDEWLAKTLKACVELTTRDEDNESNINLEVLRVCYEIKLQRFGQNAIHSEDLVKAINEKKDSELAYLNNFGIDQNYLAKRLNVFGIKSQNVRVAGTVRKGYYFNDFVIPAQRFLSENLRTQAEIPTDPAELDSVENQNEPTQGYFA